MMRGVLHALPPPFNRKGSLQAKGMQKIWGPHLQGHTAPQTHTCFICYFVVGGSFSKRVPRGHQARYPFKEASCNY